MAKPRFSIVVLMLLVVMESATMAFTSSASVNIYNQIAIEPPIQVHCKLGNIVDIMKETTVRYGQYVGFGFKPNIWGTTRYNCAFKWGSRTQAFDVWVDDFFLALWLKRPCKQCVWLVGQDGFFRLEAGHGYEELVYTWR